MQSHDGGMSRGKERERPTEVGRQTSDVISGSYKGQYVSGLNLHSLESRWTSVVVKFTLS